MAVNGVPRRVVVVDREETFRHQLVRRLLSDGHDACAVADSLSAFRLARWIALDTAIIGDPANAASDAAPGVLRYLVTFIIRLSDERLARQDGYDLVLPRAVDLDALCLTLGSDRVATASLDSCGEQIRPGMHCGRTRGHDGLHRWMSFDAGRSFVWG